MPTGRPVGPISTMRPPALRSGGQWPALQSAIDPSVDVRPQTRVAKERETEALRKTRFAFSTRPQTARPGTAFNFNDQTVAVSTRVVETPFHNTGLFNIGGTGAFPEPNRGLFETTGIATDMGRFRAPSLRNIEVTAPYRHDGSIETLEQVLDFYAAGGRVISDGPHAGDGRTNPFKSDLVSRITLSAQERADIVAFLRTLTDQGFLTDAKLADPFATR